MQVRNSFETETSNDQPNIQDVVKDILPKKDRRKSLSRRVSFSTTTRIKEFHEGQHEVR